MACRLTGLSRSAYRRTLKADTVADPDAALREWLRGYAKKHPRWGYRRAYHDARGEGWQVNHKKIQRLWREEGLRVPQRRRRKRIGSSTADAPKACAPNVVWAIDFQFDVDEAGQTITDCAGFDVKQRDTGNTSSYEAEPLAFPTLGDRTLAYRLVARFELGLGDGRLERDVPHRRRLRQVGLTAGVIAQERQLGDAQRFR